MIKVVDTFDTSPLTHYPDMTPERIANQTTFPNGVNTNNTFNSYHKNLFKNYDKRKNKKPLSSNFKVTYSSKKRKIVPVTSQGVVDSSGRKMHKNYVNHITPANNRATFAKSALDTNIRDTSSNDIGKQLWVELIDRRFWKPVRTKTKSSSRVPKSYQEHCWEQERSTSHEVQKKPYSNVKLRRDISLHKYSAARTKGFKNVSHLMNPIDSSTLEDRLDMKILMEEDLGMDYLNKSAIRPIEETTVVDLEQQSIQDKYHTVYLNKINASKSLE